VSRDAVTAVRSLAWATDLDVLPLDRVDERRDGFLVVKSPSNPAHFWGNFLLFDDVPAPGDAIRWEALFDTTFAADPQVRHRAFGWDRTDGASGAARDEFADRGYDFEDSVGLIADAPHLARHPRENREVVVQALDPAAGADGELWDAVVELQVAGRDDAHDEASYRAFTRARLEDRRALFRSGRGAWYVAIDPTSEEVAGSCGIVVTGGRGRFQVVDTALAHRRCGVCSRLVVEAARRAREDFGARQFVIVADAGYHALGLYESLGFERIERVAGVCLWPAQVPERPELSSGA
jgi:ribosomal protein S18 acetylase RimI-like enzyme